MSLPDLLCPCPRALSVGSHRPHGAAFLRSTFSILCAVILASVVTASGDDTFPAPGPLLMHESFEDTSLSARGWYDGVRLEIVEDETAPHGDHANLWHWPNAGAISPTGGSARLALPPTGDVTIGFSIRLGPKWAWTGRSYHPHMFSLITNADTRYGGPARTHLTTYVEVVDGVYRLALQDARNIDTTHIDAEAPWQEGTAIAGCNGDADGKGAGDCYRSGDSWLNGKIWTADRVLLPTPEDDLPSDWHTIHARFRLNTVTDGVTHRDGVLQMWFDVELIIDVHDAVLRSARHPDMLFNQLFVGPYYGPGVPHAQSMWIDDLRVWDSSATTAVQAANWGQVKQRGDQP